jgi:hypothetical protein
MSDAGILRRTRELFLSAGKNASVLDALKDALLERGLTDTLPLTRKLREAARKSNGEDWRIKTLDRAIDGEQRKDGATSPSPRP